MSKFKILVEALLLLTTLVTACYAVEIINPTHKVYYDGS